MNGCQVMIPTFVPLRLVMTSIGMLKKSAADMLMPLEGVAGAV